MLLQALFIISQPSVNSNWSYSPETPNLGQNQWFFFVPCDLELWWLTLHKANLFDCCNWPSNHTQTGFKSSIFQPVWSWYLMDDLKNNRVPLPYYIKLYASFPLVNSNWSYSPKTLNSGQNQPFFPCVTLKFDRWPWKTIGHLFYITLSFVHYFKPSVNSNWSYSPDLRSIWVKISDFLSHVTLKFNGWPS